MKILNQYIVETVWGLTVIYECEDNIWWELTKGAFGQRELYLARLSHEQAKVYLNNN